MKSKVMLLSILAMFSFTFTDALSAPAAQAYDGEEYEYVEEDADFYADADEYVDENEYVDEYEYVDEDEYVDEEDFIDLDEYE